MRRWLTGLGLTTVVALAGCGHRERTLSTNQTVAALHAAGFERVHVLRQAEGYNEARRLGIPLSGRPAKGPDYLTPVAAPYLLIVRTNSVREARRPKVGVRMSNGQFDLRATRVCNILILNWRPGNPKANAAAKLVSSQTPLPAAVAPWSIVAATLLGTVVGIVSGVYPARRASLLDPIEALRQE